MRFTIKTYLVTASLLTALVLGGLGGQPQGVSAEPAAGVNIAVNTLVDEMTDDGNCSLREAVWAANNDKPKDACPAGSGDDFISLPQGTLTLSIAGNEELGLQGDLDLLSNVTISGWGPDKTTINAGQIDRVFHVFPSVTANLYRMTILNGLTQGTGDKGGGAILNDLTGKLTLQYVALSSSQSTKRAGALENNGLTNVWYSTISGNTAALNAGAIYNSGTLNIFFSTLSGNQVTAAEGIGGAIDDRNSTTLWYVTVSGNTASTGGGINSDGNLNVFNSTIVENSDGLFFYGVSNSIVNTIIAKSTSGVNCAIGGLTPINSQGHNVEDGNTCNFHMTGDKPGVDPLLDALADNGGPTKTYALKAGSPAIDAGDKGSCSIPGLTYTIDQRGYSRPMDGGSGSKICDIGSFEFNGVKPNLFVFMPLIIK